MRKDEMDPFAYIESAFLDAPEPDATVADEESPIAEKALPAFLRNQKAESAPQPKGRSHTLVDAIRVAKLHKDKEGEKRKKVKDEPPTRLEEPPTIKLKKTDMRAPRPRKRRKPAPVVEISEEMTALWEQIPKNLKFLGRVYDDDVTQKYYSTKFRESRAELIRSLIDPELNLEDTARLLGVCPATVRRYTNRGWLKHHRTEGNQRRFRLSGIVEFVDKHGRNPE